MDLFKSYVNIIILLYILLLCSETTSKSNSISTKSTKLSSLKSLSTFLAAFGSEAFTYFAAPFFMPIAIGRAVRSPPGLGSNAAPLIRFGKFIFNSIGRRKDRQFRDELLTYLTKHRRNIMLTMELYRQLERENKRSERKTRKRN